MAFTKFLFLSALSVIAFEEVCGHGRLWDPVNRSSAGKKNFPVPVNYNDNENFCGGWGVQHTINGGKCGPCGDDYRIGLPTRPGEPARPRPNENGGKYGLGVIVKNYKQGEQIRVEVDLSASHNGYFEFAACPLKGPKDVETEECFDQHPIKLANGSDKFYPNGRDLYKIDLVLPAGLTCDHCTFRWHYRTGNTWGLCKNSTEGRNGCGPQETFRSCSDVSIL